MFYSHITKGIIDAGPLPLPKAWRNISGLDRMDAAGLKAIGWLPVRYVGDAYAPATQIRTGPDLVVGADEVVGTYTVRDKTAPELDAEKDAEVTGLMRRGAIKALALVCADKFGMTPAQMKAAIKAKM